MMKWIGLSDDGNTITLKKFHGNFRIPPQIDEHWMRENADRVRKGAVIDVETTGLNPAQDRIIEVGIRFFDFDRTNGQVLRIGEGLSQLQDPGVPLSDDVKRLTGLSDEDLNGQAIDWDEVDSKLADVDLLIAHNAAFDRPFVDAQSKVSGDRVWACSLKYVDWLGKGFDVQKLNVLSLYHGFFIDAHRALNDVDALLHLLSFDDDRTQKPYLNEVLINARKPFVHVVAENSPFHSKDHLKRRGYRWNASSKVWQKTISGDRVEDEIVWMEAMVYNGKFGGKTMEIAPQDMFKGVRTS